MNRPPCFEKQMPDGKPYEPACTALDQVPEDAPEEFNPRGLYTCAACDEDFWQALKAAADARAQRMEHEERG